MQRSLNKEQIHMINETFQVADEGMKGYLNQNDTKIAVMAMFGYKPSKNEVLDIFASHARALESRTTGLSLAQFREAMAPKLLAVDEDEEIRNTFTAFDRNCRGFLNFEDVRKVFSEICPHLPEESVRLAFKELDRDGDGRVSYKDFDFMMKFNNFL